MKLSMKNYLDLVENNMCELENNLAKTKKYIFNINNIKVEKSQSSLTIEDILICIIAGFLGGALSSSKDIERIFANIHDNSSKNTKTFLEKLLYHAGDEIDKGGNYITRKGDKPEFGFHRLFFGHDILSIKGDNPLMLMIEQYGIVKGITQLLRHLIADTFSKQGLPLPGHSFLDYTKTNGRTGNYLINLTKHLNKGSNIGHLGAFNHLFSIRMQDILAQGLTWGIITSYIKAMKIQDKIRISQLKFSAYSISFFVNAVSGMVNTGGLPYINWTTFSMLTKESFTFFKLNYEEIKELESLTDNIIKSNIKLEERVFATGGNIRSFDCADDFFLHLGKEKEIFDDLTNFFEEV